MDITHEEKGNHVLHTHTYFINKYFLSVLLPEHLQQSGKSHFNSWEAAH